MPENQPIIIEQKKRVRIYPAPLFSNTDNRGSKIVEPTKVIKKTLSVKSGAGFTLMELIVSIAIFAILAVGMLASFGIVTKAAKTAREKTILSSLSTYYLEVVRRRLQPGRHFRGQPARIVARPARTPFHKTSAEWFTKFTIKSSISTIRRQRHRHPRLQTG